MPQAMKTKDLRNRFVSHSIKVWMMTHARINSPAQKDVLRWILTAV